MSSIIGTHDTQRNASEAKSRDSASQAERNQFANRLQNAIEETEKDNEVYSDSEGLGSQGRPSESDESEAQRDEEQQDESTPGGLDIQA
jgi:hypothetical protein